MPGEPCARVQGIIGCGLPEFSSLQVGDDSRSDISCQTLDKLCVRVCAQLFLEFPSAYTWPVCGEAVPGISIHQHGMTSVVEEKGRFPGCCFRFQDPEVRVASAIWIGPHSHLTGFLPEAPVDSDVRFPAVERDVYRLKSVLGLNCHFEDSLMNIVLIIL